MRTLSRADLTPIEATPAQPKPGRVLSRADLTPIDPAAVAEPAAAAPAAKKVRTLSRADLKPIEATPAPAPATEPPAAQPEQLPASPWQSAPAISYTGQTSSPQPESAPTPKEAQADPIADQLRAMRDKQMAVERQADEAVASGQPDNITPQATSPGLNAWKPIASAPSIETSTTPTGATPRIGEAEGNRIAAQNRIAALDAMAAKPIETGDRTFSKVVDETLTTEKAIKMVPYLGGAKDLADALDVYNAVHRFDKGKASARDLDVLLRFHTESQRETTWGGSIADILVQLPGFWGEMATTGGAYTIPKEATERATFAAARKYLGKAISNRLAKRLAQGAGWAVGSAAQASLAMPVRAAADAVGRRTFDHSNKQGLFTLSDEGQVIVNTPDESFAASLAKAVGSSAIEVASEHTGKGVGLVAGKLAGMVPGSAKAKALKTAIAAMWMNKTGLTTPDLMKKVASATAWDGVLEEIGEEEVGKIMRWAAQIDDYQVTSPAELAAQAVAFAVPGAGSRLVQRTERAIRDRQLTGEYGSPEAARAIVEAQQQDAEAGNLATADDVINAARAQQQAPPPVAETTPQTQADAGIATTRADARLVAAQQIADIQTAVADPEGGHQVRAVSVDAGHTVTYADADGQFVVGWNEKFSEAYAKHRRRLAEQNAKAATKAAEQAATIAQETPATEAAPEVAPVAGAAETQATEGQQADTVVPETMPVVATDAEVRLAAGAGASEFRPEKQRRLAAFAEANKGKPAEEVQLAMVRAGLQGQQNTIKPLAIAISEHGDIVADQLRINADRSEQQEKNKPTPEQERQREIASIKKIVADAEATPIATTIASKDVFGNPTRRDRTPKELAEAEQKKQAYLDKQRAILKELDPDGAISPQRTESATPGTALGSTPPPAGGEAGAATSSTPPTPERKRELLQNINKAGKAFQASENPDEPTRAALSKAAQDMLDAGMVLPSAYSRDAMRLLAETKQTKEATSGILDQGDKTARVSAPANVQVPAVQTPEDKEEAEIVARVGKLNPMALAPRLKAIAKELKQLHIADEAAYDAAVNDPQRLTRQEEISTAKRRALNSEERAIRARLNPPKAADGQGATPTVREMDHEGRPTDNKPILPGDQFKTSSGRATTPYPKYPTGRQTLRETKKSDAWLIENAVAEAKARGDNFNAKAFASETPGNLPPASIASMQEYLFGQQPRVPAPFTRPLSAGNATPPAATADADLPPGLDAQLADREPDETIAPWIPPRRDREVLVATRPVKKLEAILAEIQGKGTYTTLKVSRDGAGGPARWTIERLEAQALVEELQDAAEYYSSRKKTGLAKLAANLAVELRAKAGIAYRDRKKGGTSLDISQVPLDTTAAREAVQAQDREGAGQPFAGDPVKGVKGRRGVLRLANGQERAVTYMAVEADDLIPTHDARKQFTPNAAGDLNERPYEHPVHGAASRATVARIAADTNYDTLLSDTPTMTDGPPAAAPSGQVLGGNARAMAMQVIYGQKNADRLRASVIDAAPKFGLDAAQVQGMRSPVIVRVLDDAGRRGELSRVLNDALTTAKTGATDSASRAHKLTDATRSMVADMMTGASEEMSLREVLADSDLAMKVVRAMVRDGAWTDADVTRHVDREGRISEEGKAIIENMMLAWVTPDVGALGQMPRSAKNKILRSLGALMWADRKENKGRDVLMPALRTAVTTLADWKASGLPANDYFFGQQSLTPPAGFGDVAVASVASALDTMPGKAFKQAVLNYLDDAGLAETSGALDFGNRPEPMSPAAALRKNVGANLTGPNVPAVDAAPEKGDTQDVTVSQDNAPPQTPGTPSPAFHAKQKDVYAAVIMPDRYRTLSNAMLAAIPAELEATAPSGDPHITVRYGLDPGRLQELQDAIGKLPPFTVTVRGAMAFQGRDEGHVVLAADRSPELMAINKLLEGFAPPRDDNAPFDVKEYTPHVTVAHTPLGRQKQAADAINEAFGGRQTTSVIDHVIVYDQHGDKHVIALQGVHADVGQNADTRRRTAAEMAAELPALRAAQALKDVPKGMRQVAVVLDGSEADRKALEAAIAKAGGMMGRHEHRVMATDYRILSTWGGRDAQAATGLELLTNLTGQRVGVYQVFIPHSDYPSFAKAIPNALHVTSSDTETALDVLEAWLNPLEMSQGPDAGEMGTHTEVVYEWVVRKLTEAGLYGDIRPVGSTFFGGVVKDSPGDVDMTVYADAQNGVFGGMADMVRRLLAIPGFVVDTSKGAAWRKYPSGIPFIKFELGIDAPSVEEAARLQNLDTDSLRGTDKYTGKPTENREIIKTDLVIVPDNLFQPYRTGSGALMRSLPGYEPLARYVRRRKMKLAAERKKADKAATTAENAEGKESTNAVRLRAIANKAKHDYKAEKMRLSALMSRWTSANVANDFMGFYSSMPYEPGTRVTVADRGDGTVVMADYDEGFVEVLVDNDTEPTRHQPRHVRRVHVRLGAEASEQIKTNITSVVDAADPRVARAVVQYLDPPSANAVWQAASTIPDYLADVLPEEYKNLPVPARMSAAQSALLRNNETLARIQREGVWLDTRMGAIVVGTLEDAKAVLIDLHRDGVLVDGSVYNALTHPIANLHNVALRLQLDGQSVPVTIELAEHYMSYTAGVVARVEAIADKMADDFHELRGVARAAYADLNDKVFHAFRDRMLFDTDPKVMIRRDQMNMPYSSLVVSPLRGLPAARARLTAASNTERGTDTPRRTISENENFAGGDTSNRKTPRSTSATGTPSTSATGTPGGGRSGGLQGEDLGLSMGDSSVDSIVQTPPKSKENPPESDKLTPPKPPQNKGLQQPANKTQRPAKRSGMELLSQDKQDRAKAARDKILKALGGGQVNFGVDPQVMLAALELGGLHLEAGAKSFARWATAMLDDLKAAEDKVLPHLRGLYAMLSMSPNTDKSGMTDISAVNGWTDEDVRLMVAGVRSEAAAEGTITNQEQTADEPRSDEPVPDDAGLETPGAEGPAADADGGAGDVRGGLSGDRASEPDAGQRRGPRRTRRGAGPDGGGRAEVERPDAAGEDAAAGPAADAQPGEGDSAGTARTGVVESPAAPAYTPPADPAARNHVITDTDTLAPRGNVAKLQANLRAMEVEKRLRDEKRHATAAEKKLLAQYTGWGWAGQFFDRNSTTHAKEYAQLVEAFGSETNPDFIAARASTVNAHYTAPEVIKAMWTLAERLGFKGGPGATILEPAGGVGHFFGLMPTSMQGARMVGVELDNVSGRIFKALYPEADIQIRGYETVQIPKDSVSLAISNVPFGSFKLSSKDYPNLLIHDFFFARALDQVAPGGLLMFITSDGTLNKEGPAVRKLLATKADLVGAIRLPNNAFKANAGTEVTTDIVVMRKKDGSGFVGEPFLKTVKVGEDMVDGKPVDIRVNEYFVKHPDMALGEHGMKGTMYNGRGDYALTAKPGQDTPALLNAAVEAFPANIFNAKPATEQTGTRKLAEAADRDGSIVVRDGDIFQVEDGQLVKPDWMSVKAMGDAYDQPLTDDQATARVAIAKRWLALRDTMRELLDAENSTASTPPLLAKLRAKLNREYDAYHKDYGTVTRDFRYQEKAGFLENEPDYPLVQALEEEDGLKPNAKGKMVKHWKKGAIFTKRLREPKTMPASVQTADEAVSVSLGYLNRIDPDLMGKLLGKSPEEAEQAALESGRAFHDPATGKIDTRERYLSGNVVKKLAAARVAAEADAGKYGRNVLALEQVQPKRVELGEIYVGLSSRWVPDDVLSAFATHLMGAPSRVRQSREANAYTVTGATDAEQWATNAMTAGQLLKHALDGTDPIVRRTEMTLEGEKRVVDQQATTAARMAKEKIEQEFERWVRTEHGRAGGEDAPLIRTAIEDAYNAANNSVVPAQYDGSYLALPGLSNAVHRTAHRLSVVARILQEGYAVMAHGVGSGKTFSIIVAAQESKRLGLAKKNMIVVQNATLGQFAASYRQAYPDARILVATEKSFSAKNRQRLFARIAVGDYDAVIVSQSQFDLIASKPAAVKEYFQEQMDKLESAARAAAREAGKADPSVKRLEAQKKTLEVKLKKILDKLGDRQDNMLFFEDLGVDRLFIDEAHAYKRIPIATRKQNVKGVPTESSSRAANLEIKLRHIQRNNDGKGVITATGTPVTNTMAEAFVQLRLAAPNVLREYNIDNFDDFANTFGQTRSQVEFTWSQQWKLVTRFNRFVNGPELTTMIRSGFDVKMGNKALGLRVPDIKGGKPELLLVPQTDAMANVNDWLMGVASAYEALSPSDRREQSHIPITTMQVGMAASLDPRLVDPSLPDDPKSKVNVAVRRIASIWRKTAKDKSTQIVFADRFKPMDTSSIGGFMGDGKPKAGTDIDAMLDAAEAEQAANADVSESAARSAQEDDAYNSGGFNLYHDIKAKLVKAGIPAAQIAVIHDYKNDKQRMKMFDAMKAGEIRVLIGSTEKIGVGVNVQDKLVAAHHLDPPRMMTPAMVEQRDGRIIRQGNTNTEVEVIRYGVERSMDTGIYQMLESKQRFIVQALSGRMTAREFEDAADELSLSLAEQKAMLTGDNRVIQKVALEAEVRQLESEQIAFESERGGRIRRMDDARSILRGAERQAPILVRYGETLAKAFPQGGGFTATIMGYEYGDRAQVVEAIDKLSQSLGMSAAFVKERREEAIEVNGVRVVLKAFPSMASGRVDLNAVITDADGKTIRTVQYEKANGLLLSLVHTARNWPQVIEENQKQIAALKAHITALSENIDAAWPHTAKLNDAKTRLHELNDALLSIAADPVNVEVANRLSKAMGRRVIFRNADQRFVVPNPRGGEPVPMGLVLETQQQVNEDIKAREAAERARQEAATEGTTSDSQDLRPAMAAGRLPAGRPQSQDQTETPEFRRWFGTSKVVDANGKPLRVYHGTSSDFAAFDMNVGGSNTGAKNGALGAFFTDSPVVSGAFGDRSMPVYLSLRNPLEMGFFEYDRDGSINPWKSKDGYEPVRQAIAKTAGKPWGEVTRDDVLAWKRKVQSLGWDGLVITTQMDSRELVSTGSRRGHLKPHKMYIAFEPTQIKSAIGNQGTFDPSDPDIRRGSPPPPTGPAGTQTNATPSAYASRPPETKAGADLVKSIAADPDGKRVGMRSIVQMAANLVGAQMRVGREQTNARRPGTYTGSGYHVIRSRTGAWQLDLHEAGHALAEVLKDAGIDIVGPIRSQLVSLAQAKGSYASADSAEEGFAEWVRRYVTEPHTIPNALTNRIEATIEKASPELMRGLRDLHRAMVAHTSRSISAQIRSYGTDKAPPASFSERARDVRDWAYYKLLSGEAALHQRVYMPLWKALAQHGVEVARAYDAAMRDTEADYTQAYQTSLHVPYETSRALWGDSAEPGQRGLRIRQTGAKFMDSIVAGLSESDQWRAIHTFHIPKLAGGGRHGEFLYLTDYTVQDVIDVITGKGKNPERWEAFETYGQMRAALDRFEKKGHRYPGMTENLSPGAIKAELRRVEAANPDFSHEFIRINKYMDQMLLVSVLSGEIGMKDALTIAEAYESYWPLPRQSGPYSGATPAPKAAAAGAGAEPSAGIMRAFGSDMPFRSILESVEHRTRRALGAYYANRVMQSVHEALRRVNADQSLPLATRAPLRRLLMPLEMDWQPTQLDPVEIAQVISEHLTGQKAKELQTTPDKLDDADRIRPEDVDVAIPGVTLWREVKPNAVRLIAPFINGRRVFMQVDDPVLYEFFARARAPHKVLQFLAGVQARVNAPVKRALTQNIAFALRGVLRDVQTAMSLAGEVPGTSSDAGWIPGLHMVTGLMNRLTRRVTDAREVGEMWSRALVATHGPRQRGRLARFKAMMAEGIILPDYADKGWAERGAALPGQLMSTLMKPIELVNWATGGMWLANTMESVQREGAFVLTRRGGGSGEAAQNASDRVTGNFTARAGSANAQLLYQMGLFVNPAIQILWQNLKLATDPDPRRRWRHLGLKLPWLALSSALAYAINWLLLDDDDKEQLRERPDEERAAFAAVKVPGTKGVMLQLPFDYGPAGAAASLGWNLMESILLKDSAKGDALAAAVLDRALSIPSVLDVLTPQARLALEMRTNYKLFWNQPVVPQHLQSAYRDNPALQAYDHTPDWAKAAGGALGVSPLQVEYALSQTLTAQANSLLNTVERLATGKGMGEELPDMPVIGRLFLREPRGSRAQSVRDVRDADAVARGARALANNMAGGADADEMEEIAALRRQAADLTILSNAAKRIDALAKRVKAERKQENPDMELIRELEREQVRIAQHAIAAQREQQATAPLIQE